MTVAGIVRSQPKPPFLPLLNTILPTAVQSKLELVVATLTSYKPPVVAASSADATPYLYGRPEPILVILNGIVISLAGGPLATK